MSCTEVCEEAVRDVHMAEKAGMQNACIERCEDPKDGSRYRACIQTLLDTGPRGVAWMDECSS